QLPLLCPRRDCQRVFIAYYRESDGGSAVLESVSRGARKVVDFSEIINEISPSFIKIYQQAYIAEQDELFEICGVGYRKALEFLVKDYAIQNHTSEKEKIEKTQLGPCIKDYINDERVKSVAKRATWLGNDETHYVRRWEGKNLADLKALIRLTIHWLEMEAETKRFEQEMPE
nr:DUF4145 domain-containing protein [Acidobacteriota bacterium]